MLPEATPVLAAQAEEGASAPYGLLLEAVGPLVEAWADVPEELADRRAALSVLLGPVAPDLTPPDGERPLSSDELTRAGVELLRHLLGNGPGVVVFEDLHWADADSLALFGRLAVMPPWPLLLVGSFRPEALGSQLTGVIAGIERHRVVEQLRIERLTTPEVTELLSAVYGRPVPSTVAQALHDRTGGSPLFVEELLVAAGDAAPEDLPRLALPATLTEALLRHLDGLLPDERRVVDAAAVLGQRISFDLLAAVTGTGESELIDVLRSLVGRGLIVEDDVDVFAFRHALTREAVASRLLGRERRRLHEKALAALQEEGSRDWAALARHASGAGRWDDVVEAARHGAKQYLFTGSTYQALHLAELGLQEADTDLDLLELAAVAAWSLGQPQSALDRGEQWLRAAEEVDSPAAQVRALRLLARLRWEQGDPPGQSLAVDRALSLGEGLPPSPERVMVANLAAERAMLNGRREEAVQWADEALARADQTDGADDLRPAILVNKGAALIDWPGQFDEGIALLQAGIAEGERVGDYLASLRGLWNLTKSVFPLWAPDASAALLLHMERLVDVSGRRDWASRLHAKRAELLSREGDLQGARAELVEARREHSAWWDVALPAAELALEAGDLEAAADDITALLGRAPWPELDDHLWLLGAHARLLVAQGQLDLAVDTLAGITRILVSDAGRLGCGCGVDAAFEAALDLVRHGADPQAVAGALAPARQVHEREQVVKDPAWPHHVDGAMAEATGEAPEAAAAYTRALAPTGRTRAPRLDADAHAGLARVLLGQGDLGEARQHADEAVRLLARWPGWRQAEAEALARRLSTTADGGSRGLTARELEVVRLVADGLSNGEIAKRLYVSPKTASVHVSNILSKLGMARRAEVAAWAVREGLS